ncbi:hypothetical protein K1719_026278 [Acacia pycnantha]|nr:hypothetical protein K1719_026278 [Acacia pycnantha]
MQNSEKSCEIGEDIPPPLLFFLLAASFIGMYRANKHDSVTQFLCRSSLSLFLNNFEVFGSIGRGVTC